MIHDSPEDTGQSAPRATGAAATDKAEHPAVQPGFVRELVVFAWRYKFFWIAPVVVFAVFLLGLLFFNYSYAPFHYTVM